MDKIVNYIIENAVRRYLNEEIGKEVADNTRVELNPKYAYRQFSQNNAAKPVNKPQQQNSRPQTAQLQAQSQAQPQAQPVQQDADYNPATFDGMTRPMSMNFSEYQRKEMAAHNAQEMAPDQVWGIVIHYSGSDINNKRYNINSIKSGHRKRNYYQDIAYNFVIDRDGTILKGRDTNVRNQGTGNVAWNKHSLAICYIGGTDKKNGPRKRDGEPKGFDTRTPQQKASLVKLIKALKKNFPTITDVRGHNQVPGNATGCPGFDAHKEYQHLVGKENPNNPLYALR